MAEKVEKAPKIKIADDPDRLSKPATRAVEALAGCRLCKQYVIDERIPRGVTYWIEPTGRKVDADAAEELIRKGRLLPLKDALFDDQAQSFELAAA